MPQGPNTRGIPPNCGIPRHPHVFELDPAEITASSKSDPQAQMVAVISCYSSAHSRSSQQSNYVSRFIIRKKLGESIYSSWRQPYNNDSKHRNESFIRPVEGRSPLVWKK